MTLQQLKDKLMMSYGQIELLASIFRSDSTDLTKEITFEEIEDWLHSEPCDHMEYIEQTFIEDDLDLLLFFLRDHSRLKFIQDVLDEGDILYYKDSDDFLKRVLEKGMHEYYLDAFMQLQHFLYNNLDYAKES